MKKLFSLLVTIAFATTLAGCSESDTASTSSPAATTASQDVSVSSAKATKTVAAEQGDKFELGKPVELGDYTVTIKTLSVVKDYEGKPVLKATYDWKNNSDKPASPFMTFTLKAFQDGVELDSGFSEEIDLGIGQKEVKPGVGITDAEEAAGVVDLAKPVDLELEEAFSFSSKPLTLTIPDLNNL